MRQSMLSGTNLIIWLEILDYTDCTDKHVTLPRHPALAINTARQPLLAPPGRDGLTSSFNGLIMSLNV